MIGELYKQALACLAWPDIEHPDGARVRLHAALARQHAALSRLPGIPGAGPQRCSPTATSASEKVRRGLRAGPGTC
jgi:hypothetical protein